MPVAFCFEVKIKTSETKVECKPKDTSFMEVSGLSSKMDVEQYIEGGNHGIVYNLPKGIKYDNLVLKRGITTLNSNFAIWCQKNLMSGTISKIITGTLEINLINRFGYPGRVWKFSNAYPVKWSVDQLNSKKNELAIETIEICYSSLTREM